MRQIQSGITLKGQSQKLKANAIFSPFVESLAASLLRFCEECLPTQWWMEDLIPNIARIAKSCTDTCISSAVKVSSCFYSNILKYIVTTATVTTVIITTVTIWIFEFCHNSFIFWHNCSFWTLSQLMFCHIKKKKKFCHSLSFWVWSQFDFFSLLFVTIWVFEFCNNLCFWVSSHFEFLSFVTILLFEFCHCLSFWVLSQFLFLSFVTISVFRFWHNFSF